MGEQLQIELMNPQTNILAFRMVRLYDDSYFRNLKSFDCYKIILIRKGKGHLVFDKVSYEFSENCLIRFPIYQPFQISTDGLFEGVLLQFHPDFFWNHKYDLELTSKQVLFKNIGEIPSIKISKAEMDKLLLPLDHLISELGNNYLGRYDISVSWVKIFMIYASRIKMERGVVQSDPLSATHVMSRNLINAVEKHFHRKHRPADYAKLLNVTVKTLNRVANQHAGKTVGEMISDRIITQAKHELYLSDKSIKEISLDLGFSDVAYFSRFFKTKMNIPPDGYRKSIRKGVS